MRRHRTLAFELSGIQLDTRACKVGVVVASAIPMMNLTNRSVWMEEKAARGESICAIDQTVTPPVSNLLGDENEARRPAGVIAIM
mmetsp:Transcript_12178/g.15962  ORF Transcript_12178/g.15962 Transcript_12178/m.15962 type:complete len:85 (+) Transcript_12178:1279-1533(+)